MAAGYHAVLAHLLSRASYFSGREARPESLIYGDLDINGSDFIEFVEDVERQYGTDLSWMSPRDPREPAQDATVEDVARYVTR